MKKATKSKSMREGGRGVNRKSSRTAAVAGVTRSKPKTAYELLQRVCEHILEEPRRYNQERWLMRGKRYIKDFGLSAPACGTVGCRAGWIVLLHDGMKAKVTDETCSTGWRAAQILGLDVPRYGNATFDLFAGGGVSGKVGTKTYAERGAAGIRVFMAEHKFHLKARLLKDVPKLESK